MPDFLALINNLKQNKISFIKDEILAKHTSFQIGGIADMFILPQTQEQLIASIILCKKNNIKYFLLGKGTNVLFVDSGYRGAVISIGNYLNDLSVRGNTITVGAGANLADVCIAARDNSLTGLEFAYGIPGCIGGAVFMNAGAYDGEMKDVLVKIMCADEQGNIVEISNAQAEFAYRASIFQSKPLCILGAEIALKKGEKTEIDAKMKDLLQRRTDKQPLNLPSAGSAFKRPDGAYASALIDKCGLRGKCVGGAAISEKHCGFIVNNGGATCADVLNLANEVCRLVLEQTGYNLEKEIRVIE